MLFKKETCKHTRHGAFSLPQSLPSGIFHPIVVIGSCSGWSPLVTRWGCIYSDVNQKGVDWRRNTSVILQPLSAMGSEVRDRENKLGSVFTVLLRKGRPRRFVGVDGLLTTNNTSQKPLLCTQPSTSRCTTYSSAFKVSVATDNKLGNSFIVVSCVCRHDHCRPLECFCYVFR